MASALTEVASFIHRQAGDPDADSVSTERRLRWLLLENPLATSGSPHGFCVRDGLGIIRGVTLCFPAAFLAAEQRFLGLGAGGLYVEPGARMLGFYLFKKYLSSPGCSFFFATTCNAASAALWGKLGACAVKNAEPEHILPLRLDTLLPALLAEKTSGRVASAIARIFGRCGDPILQFLERRSDDLTTEPCQDWPKLSELFRRHRPKDWITTDRSAEFLEWRYGQNADPYPSGVYLFRDKRGNEGWFSLGDMVRGRRRQIRACVVLDAIWPREKMSFRQIFPSILRLAAAKYDVISLRPRPGVDYGECSRWFIRRKRAPSSIFAISRLGDPRWTVASLDLVPADGDSALPISLLAHYGDQRRYSRPCVC